MPPYNVNARFVKLPTLTATTQLLASFEGHLIESDRRAARQPRVTPGRRASNNRLIELVHRIDGVRGAQAYLFEGLDGLAVVDPGYTGSHQAVLRFMANRNFQPSDLRWVILTHHHIDHAGAVHALCKATGARLAVHRGDAPYLKAGRPRERMTLWGLADRLPDRVACYLVTCATGDVHLLDDGDSINGLTVVHAPGHTPGSICLWSQQASVLFAGDVLNNERGLRTPPWTVNHSHRQARLAPMKLSGLGYQQAFFGHGPPIFEHADEWVRALLQARSAAEGGAPDARSAR